MGAIIILLIGIFFYKSCEEYNELFPDKETQEERTRKEMERFQREIELEKAYYQQKWEREHPEEVKRKKESEKWLKENGYR